MTEETNLPEITPEPPPDMVLEEPKKEKRGWGRKKEKKAWKPKLEKLPNDSIFLSRLGYKVGIPLIATVLIAISLLIWQNVNAQTKMLTEQSEVVLREHFEIFNISLDAQEGKMLALAKAIAGDTDIQQAMASIDREALTRITVPIFEALEEVKVFHFHTPSAITVLRAHKPEKFGDDLSWRSMVVEVNGNQEPLTGIEPGVHGLAIRGMVPIDYNGEHTGSLEFGQFMSEEFLNNVQERIPGSDIAIFVREDMAVETMTGLVEELGTDAPAGFLVYGSTKEDRLPIEDSPYQQVMNTGEQIFMDVTSQGYNYSVILAPLLAYDGSILAVVEIDIPSDEILNTITQNRNISILIGAFIIFAVSAVLLFYLFRSILTPISNLHQTAERIGGGDLSVRAEVQSTDEIGKLATTINYMATQLQTTMGKVEERTHELEDRTHDLEERAREMEASQSVTFAASERTTPEDFLELLVNLIADQFDIYHCQVYLVDEERTKAVLHQSTGYPGRQLLQRGHSIPLDQESLVTRAINTGESVLVSDVAKEPGWLANPLLPNTKSELVVPLKLEDEVIGALDIQERETDRFTNKTIPVFEAMTKQVTFLYENNELLQQIAASTEEQERFAEQLGAAAEVGGQLSSVLDPTQLMNEAVALLQSRFNFYHAHIYLLDKIEQNLVMEAGSGQVGLVLKERQHSIPLDREGSLVARAGRERVPVLVKDTTQDSDFLPNPLLPNTRSELAVPMVVGGKLIGVLDLQDDQEGRFTQVDADSLSTLAGQIATSIENARLFTSQTKSEAQFRTLVENAPEAIILVDTNTGLFEDPNENAVLLFGMPQNEINKVGPANMSPPTQPDGRSSAMAYMEYLQQAMNGERPVFEWVHTNTAGVEIPCEVRLVRLPETNKVRASVTDITERKVARDAIIQGDQLKSEFLANMSHELRTPLNSIIGYTDVMLLGVEGDLNEEIRRDLEAVRDNSDHLLRLINDVLDLAKIEAGRMTFELEQVDIEDLYKESVKESAGLLVNKNLQMEIEIQSGLPKIEVDKTCLSQVLKNLISNAIKFSEEGTITLRAIQENSWIRLEVEDQGKGIEPNCLEMIFEEFTQADPSSTRIEKGTGLGLAISQRLVHMHGGEITVESVVGKGSTFIIRLPNEATISPEVIVSNGKGNEKAKSYFQLLNE